MNSASMSAASKGKLSRKQLIFAATIGNALEFFDFTVYSFFALTIGKLFFPTMSSYGQLLASVATFGVGFVMRPLGGVVIGAYADRAGRKPAMTLTIFMMALGCALIGLAPTYAQIGVAAPMIIVLARLLQGFSAGGEVGASTTLLIEAGTPANRGLLGSYQFASQGLGVSLGALMAGLLTMFLHPDTLLAWGWRVPFLMGVAIAPLGMWIRRRLEEQGSPAARAVRMPVVTVLRDHWRNALLGTLLTMGSTVIAYVVTFYMPTYAIHELKVPATTALLAGLVSGVVTFVVGPIAGLLSDRISRRALVFWPRLAVVVLIWPAFQWLSSGPDAARLLITVGGLSVLLALQAAPAITMLPEMFPRAVRATGMAIVYSVGVAIFGGFAQAIATWLIRITGDLHAPAWYVMVCVALSCLTLPFIRDLTGKPLED
ncbi:Glycine betaine/proline/ectoine/pipecolic acid transporter OusA [Paraburkholderia caffeinitolerans]|uniref:Glycine betaine/proline/ectoine/pipecolic acid transporter OusA n=1 Tax=Paraburkholderia caffeinitolerans TaxID=1723730 RepID=A0A6J5GNI3_9BURK|nr:MFS transporter [Paraburkholderia caffeinitolerans]CAB3802938.1 Glycine betaine/proline/ectoine/pipecolic acid transporter OusA [Paraburkholderia caffeinitolerans]